MPYQTQLYLVSRPLNLCSSICIWSYYIVYYTYAYGLLQHTITIDIRLTTLLIFTGQPTPTETCIRTSVLSALTAGLSITICILSVSLMITCAKLRYRKKETSLYDAYINHKGQID